MIKFNNSNILPALPEDKALQWIDKEVALLNVSRFCSPSNRAQSGISFKLNPFVLGGRVLLKKKFVQLNRLGRKLRKALSPVPINVAGIQIEM